MSDLGVRRLVAINSGNYEFADIDLSKPVHLAAPNNRGKSTLVNALQFLYIDHFDKMRFGHRNHDDTRRHYFGSDRSYLVFECLTGSGIQCMLVRGLGNLRGAHFERYVYGGEFRSADYLAPDGEILPFEAVRTVLADRGLVQVRVGDLWQALASSLPPENGKEIPRFNILPIRRREEYTTFREVFVRLLALANANAAALRELVIQSHAREVGEQKIDVAAEYKEEFDRVERSESLLKFIHDASIEIDAGRRQRLEAAALREKVKAAAPTVWLDAHRCGAFLNSDISECATALANAVADEGNLIAKKNDLHERRGECRSEVKAAEDEWRKLEADQKKWSGYSDAFIVEMRKNESHLATQVAEQTRLLNQSESLDVDSLRRHVHELRSRLARDRKAVEQWERTAASALRRAGVSEAQLTSAFKIANPQLLKFIVGEDLTIKDQIALADRIRALAARVRSGRYSDDIVEIDLAGVSVDKEALLGDLVAKQKQLLIDEQSLEGHESQLRVGEDRKAAQKQLELLKVRHVELRRDVDAYDAHAKAWENRTVIEKRLRQARDIEKNVQAELSDCEKQLKSLAKLRTDEAEKKSRLASIRSEIEKVAEDFGQESQRHSLETFTTSDSDHSTAEDVRPKSIQKMAESVRSRLFELTEDLRRAGVTQLEVQRLQRIIADKSGHFETQQRYFSDADAEWESLIESLESLPQLETAAVKNWDALSTTLGARLNAVVTAVSSIKNAVDRLNRGLRAYKVSNLRAVQIRVEVARDTYAAIEALASQGSLFQDREEVEIAKKRLRTMIDQNLVIDLEDLFQLCIDIQQTDGVWRQASSLDEVGSTGTGMTVKAMIFIQLVRAVAVDERYRLHFYIDGLGELDDNNLSATAASAVSRGIIPITADPRLHLEPLAHPEVTVYGLGQRESGQFFVDNYKTYRARRVLQSVGDVRE